MTCLRLIVIAASAGGSEALERVASQLPADLHAALLVVLHTPEGSPRYNAETLQRHTRFRVRYAAEGNIPTSGQILLAPPGEHLVVREDGRLGLNGGSEVNFAMPAADCLFISAANVFREQVIGVVLTGGGMDGSAGLVAIKARGGMCVVQSPADAQAPSMPIHAIIRDSPNYVVLLDDLGPLLKEMVTSRDVAGQDGSARCSAD